MNKLFILCSSLLLLTSCASEYQIKGTSSVSRLDGKMLFVKVPVDETMVKVDSAEVIHGLFTMQGVVDSAMIASLYMDELSIMPLVIEKGHIQISKSRKPFGKRDDFKGGKGGKRNGKFGNDFIDDDED